MLSPSSPLRRVRIEPYVAALLATVAAGLLLPARGPVAEAMGTASKLGIALVFFLHGARLAPGRVLEAAACWRLHLLILAITFLAFPLVGFAIAALLDDVLPAPLLLGLVFLTCLSSTVQSSIGFTAIAGGNVAAAMVSASLSNLLGIVLTPLLVALLLHRGGAPLATGMVADLAVQLVLPFVAGQAARRWIGGWLEPRGRITSLADRGVILLVVYVAVSGAVVAGVWRAVSAGDLMLAAGACVLLLAGALAGTRAAARALGFPLTDEIAVLFCGSKKSIVTGVPMAGILFAPAIAGGVVVPVILYHQLQLMAGAMIAARYARRQAPIPR